MAQFRLVVGLLTLVIACAAQAQEKYLPLPDGSYLKLRPGETAREGLSRARESYPQAFIVRKIPDDKKFDVEFYNQCKLEKSRDAKTESALWIVLDSCMQLAIPRKCRKFEIQQDRFGNETGDDRIKCVQECMSANVYSRSVGECRRG
jgi:hypothetical protein